MSRACPSRLGAPALALLVLALVVAGASAQAGPPAAALDPSSAAAADATGNGFFADLLRVYTPRRLCMYEEPTVIWLHVVADLLIALAYFSIPLALVSFVRRRSDLAFNWMFQLFAVFIFACGLTHLVGVWSIWLPLYRVDGLLKLATGLVSAATAVLLWRLIPSAVALPSPSALAAANSELSLMRDDLEQRVAERTRELAEASENERDARTLAERASRTKDEFISTLSHELRTPLNAIVGWTHLLASEELSPEERRNGVEIIARNVRTQSQLIDDLLDMNRITSGLMRLELSAVDLRAAIGEALATVQPAATARKIRIETEFDPGLGLVRGDPVRLQQVVWNLVSNAVKFMDDGGRVTISLARVEGHAEIRVADEGPGISPVLLPHLFDRFNLLDSSMTRRPGGLGLGLAIVRHLVELHGGTVAARSEGAGKGATFIVRLPLATAHPDAAPDAERAQPEQAAFTPAESLAGLLDGVTVLVVDDEVDARQVASLILRRAGAEVRTAGSAAEALAVLREFRPNVLVSDLGMPGEDGLSLVRKLRKMPADQGGVTPALALTAFVREDDVRMALASGFHAHHAKPLDPADFARRVAELAGRGR